MSMYLKIDGIEGSNVVDSESGWIELSSFKMGASRFVNMKVGDCKDRECNRPTIREIIATKEMDIATASLLSKVCQGKSCGTATIYFVQTNGVYSTSSY